MYLQTIYNEAVTALNNGDYFTAFTKFFEVGSFKDSKTRGEEAFKKYYKNVRVGDVIKLGHYEQDNDDKNGTEPIEWMVVSKEDNGYTLLSKYVLFAEAMFDTDSYRAAYSSGMYTYVNSSLFENLNSSFYDTSFSNSEKEIIIPLERGRIHGEGVLGNVGILSEKELNTLFPNNENQSCYPTDYAVKNGAYKSSENGMSWYWTSSYKSTDHYYYRVNDTGEHVRVLPTIKNAGVRPTVTISIPD